MSLDLEKLENARERGGKIVARCPACAEAGADTSGEHLVILDTGLGKWGCIAHAGPHGRGHRRRIAELVGAGVSDIPLRTPPPPPRPRPACNSARPLPALCVPTAANLDEIASVRGWRTSSGSEVLVERGQLFTADVWDDGSTWPAWVATDPTRANAQARRMDGQKWTGIGAKAKSLPGTTATRVIGACCIGTRPDVWLMEGTPDLLAAPIVAKRAGLDLDRIAFACITGAGNALHADDLAHFAGKCVTIAVHADGPGAEAARGWAGQLYGAGAAEVRGYAFGIGKDLSDYLAAPVTPAETPSPANVKESPPARPPLIPLEAPFVDGMRYRLAGAHEIPSRLPLFIADPHGDTLRRHGVLILRDAA